MKKLLLILPLALILCFLVGCQDKEAMAELEEMKAQAEVEEQNKEIARQLYKAIDEQNFDTLLELSASDGVCHIPGVPDAVPIKAATDIIKSYYEAFPDSTHDIKAVIAEGDMVVIRFTQVSTHTGDYEGILPTGNKISVEGQHMFRLANGKVAEAWMVEDNLGMMMQLGMELKPKEEEK
jgi:predicted ester cyclase